MSLEPAIPTFRKASNQWLARLEAPREFLERHPSFDDVDETPFSESEYARGHSRNNLLSALPHDVLARVRPHLQRVRVEQRDLLLSPGEPIEFVYFPETMVGSLVSILNDGAATEVGTIGCEGVIGLPAFLGESASSHQAFVQVPGFAERMTVAAFARAVHSSPELQSLLLRYTQAFLTQVMLTAACNSTHLVEERCARWLLATNDRVIGEELELTHEFLAFTLGVRRAGVTVVMNSLRSAGLISYTRGRVRICDLAGLQSVACECYALVRDAYSGRHTVDAA